MLPVSSTYTSRVPSPSVGRRAVADHDRPDPPGALQPLRKVVGEVLGAFRCVGCSVSASGWPSTGHSRSFSPNASASVPFLLRLSAWAAWFPVGALASPVRPCVLAFFVAQNAPGQPGAGGMVLSPTPQGALMARTGPRPVPESPRPCSIPRSRPRRSLPAPAPGRTHTWSAP